MGGEGVKTPQNMGDIVSEQFITQKTHINVNNFNSSRKSNSLVKTSPTTEKPKIILPCFILHGCSNVGRLIADEA